MAGPEAGSSSYDNLEMLRAHFGDHAMAAILPGDSFEIDGVEFVSEYADRSTPSRFSIVKPPALVERYRALCAEVRGGRILELGIAEGGSTALLSLLADPARLVAVDLEPARIAALDEFLAARGLQDRVRPHYGIDQADRATLQALVAAEFGGEQLDLIIDDASHQLAPTRASFEALFAYLRPGGRYLIEDWNADLQMAEAVAVAVGDPDHPWHERVREQLAASLRDAQQGARARRPPLARLALELVIGCGGQTGVIDEVTMHRGFVAVTRGPAPADPATFSMDDVYHDRFDLLGPDPLGG